MINQTRIQGRPQVRESARSVELQPAAQVHSYSTAAPAVDPDLAGLVQGLQAFNPALQKWHQQETDAAIVQARADAQKVESPVDTLTGEPLPLPESVRPAYGKAYRDNFNEALAQRAAVQNKLDGLREFHEKRNDPDFDPQTWLAEKRQQVLAGITDPRAQAIVGGQFVQLEAEVQSAAEKQRLERVEVANNEALNVMLTDLATGDLGPEEQHANFEHFQGRAQRLGKSKNEAAQMYFMQLVAQSNKLGGAPELFDVFDVKDSAGKTLGDYNPALYGHAKQAQAQARQLRDRAIDESVGQSVAKTLAQYETDVDANPGAITMERLLADFTPHGAFRSPQQVASMWGRAQDAVRKRAGVQATMGLFDAGQLWKLEPKMQNQIMDARLGGLIDELSQANAAGDPAAVAQIGAKVLELHTRAGATVAFDQLKGFVTHLVTTAPNREGPNAAFTAAASLYKAMSGAPQYRDLYFNEDATKVMEAYTAAEKAGTDPKAAYTQAYQSVSPEAKAAADAFAKTPEFQKLVAGEVKNVTGSTWGWLRAFGGAGRPKNGDVVSAAAAQELRSWRARNPYASTEQAESHLEKWTASNWVMDGTSGSAVRVPPGYSAPAVQEAISAYSSELVKKYSLGDRSDADWTVQYIPVGAEGEYRPMLFNGSATQALPPVNVKTLLDAQKARTDFTPEERASIGQLRQAVAGGQPVPDVPPSLLGKAEMMGVLNPKELRALRDASNKQFMDRLNATPKVTLGSPSFDNLQHAPQKGSMKVDHSMTAKVARELLGTPVMGPGQNHTGYAASLVTMGETVALRAYDDPAHGAGKNIGMGYNLKANAKNVRQDLKRSMVPGDQIEAVVNGEASLSPDQAKRLLLVALPRYEKQVREVAQSTSPGLWERMTPAQKAVMIDIAYQTGDVDQFKRAWGALSKGDMAAFASETKVFFTDRSGNRKEDTRRNNLRASMLAGTSHWEATVDKYGSLPSSKLASLK